ncbi:unnamed protein product [Choristocarpus tenellus]
MKNSSELDGASQEGRHVGKYHLVKTIGRGSSSEVWLALDTSTGESVAIKILEKQWIYSNDVRDMVNQEIEVMEDLQHPSVLRLFKVLNSYSHVFMVMEFMEGKDLHTEIARCFISDNRAKNLFQQVLEGIAYMHSQGVAHRDMKPENLLLSKDGKRIKIADFGLAARFRGKEKDDGAISDRRRGESMVGSPRQNTVCGTPYYTAPEVFADGSSGYDPRCVDVWSSGIVLYAMLAGRLPFDGGNTSRTLQMITRDEVIYPPHFSPRVKDLLKGLLMKCPDKRIKVNEALQHPWLIQHLPKVITPSESFDWTRNIPKVKVRKGDMVGSRKVAPLLRDRRKSLPVNFSQDDSRISPLPPRPDSHLPARDGATTSSGNTYNCNSSKSPLSHSQPTRRSLSPMSQLSPISRLRPRARTDKVEGDSSSAISASDLKSERSASSIRWLRGQRSDNCRRSFGESGKTKGSWWNWSRATDLGQSTSTDDTWLSSPGESDGRNSSSLAVRAAAAIVPVSHPATVSRESILVGQTDDERLANHGGGSGGSGGVGGAQQDRSPGVWESSSAAWEARAAAITSLSTSSKTLQSPKKIVTNKTITPFLVRGSDQGKAADKERVNGGFAHNKPVSVATGRGDAGVSKAATVVTTSSIARVGMCEITIPATQTPKSPVVQGAGREDGMRWLAKETRRRPRQSSEHILREGQQERSRRGQIGDNSQRKYRRMGHVLIRANSLPEARDKEWKQRQPKRSGTLRRMIARLFGRGYPDE